MTVADMLEELNDHSFTDTSTTAKVRRLNDALYDIASREPWPFLEKTLTLTFDGISAVPSNWPSDHRATISLLNVGVGPLVPERLDVIEKNYSSLVDVAGTPVIYFFVGTQMNVLAMPASGATLRHRYFRVPPAITDVSAEADIVLPKQHHQAMVDGALFKLYDKEDDPELAVRFEQRYETRIQTMRNELHMRQFDRPERVHVIDDDDWF